MLGDIPNGDHLAVPNVRDYQNYGSLAYNQLSTSPKTPLPQPQSPSISYTLGELTDILTALWQSYQKS